MSAPTRKLAAILAADVAGYSKLMGEDETGTLGALRELRQNLLHPTVEEHRGEVVKSMGDGWLVEFASVVDAVKCAINVQENLADHEIIKLRIGIHIGDIVFEDEDIFGDGVNVVSRLETNGPPGGILLSGNVYDHLDAALSAQFIDTGAHEFKNIARPIQVYQWQGQHAPTLASVTDYLPIPDKPSIAVLPFDNMSGDPDQEYFSDGISEDIITELSKIDWLMVTARNSTFAYKGKAQNVQRICQELGVRYVMEGSVRKAGNRVRVTAQLIQAETGQHIWAERFDRELADIFDIQDEITAAVTANVDWELRQTERQIARRKRPEDLDAWQAHQRGLWHLYNLSKRDVEGAFPYFQQSIAIAPVFAPPHAGLAECLYSQVLLAMTEQPEKTMAEAYQHAVNAVEYDDNEAYGHYILGRIQAARGEHDLAIAELRRALELNPNYGMAYSGLALNHMWAGHAEECLPMVDKALQVSPRDQFRGAFMMIKACCHYFLDEPEIGEEWARKSMTVVASDFFWSHLALALCLVAQNRLDEAREAVAKACNRRPGLSVAILLRALPNYDNEYTRRANQDYLVAGLPEE